MNKFITNTYENTKKNELVFTDLNKFLFNKNEYEYDYKFIGESTMILRINNKNLILTISESDEKDFYEINIDSRLYKIVCKSELDILIEKMSTGKSESKDKKEIYSPMPGIIKKMNVKESQKVLKGEVLLVLEAMKMENEIKAKKDCVIKKINVEELKSVEKNELLLTLE